MAGQIPEADSTLHILAILILEKTGLFYDSNRLDLLADKLSPLMAEGNFQSFLDYYYFLKYDDAADKEWTRIHSALAVNETYFWREYDQIRAVAEVIIPKMQRENPDATVRIWHAASATGEEPYTMAIALTESGCYERGKVEILATDFNTTALSKARLGIFRQRSFRSIPADILTRYFISQPSNQYRVIDSIRSRVNFAYMNLMDETGMTRLRGYDIIMCRNVFIYFSDPAIQKVAGWFYDALYPSGYLFVAAAESLLRLTHLFKLVEVDRAFGYQKRSTLEDDIELHEQSTKRGRLNVLNQNLAEDPTKPAARPTANDHSTQEDPLPGALKPSEHKLDLKA